MTISVRPADIMDITWIIPLLKEGAIQGHYSRFVEQQAASLIGRIINNGTISIWKLRKGAQSPVSNIPATALVADIDGQPASFLIALIDNEEVELHLAGTLKKFRRSGCFLHLALHEIHRQPLRSRIIARCYKKSSWAIAGLKKVGFAQTQSGDPIELTLVR